MTDESIILFGKYKGEKLGNVPDEYLLWLYENNKTFGDLHKYLEGNIEVIRENVRRNKKTNLR